MVFDTALEFSRLLRSELDNIVALLFGYAVPNFFDQLDAFRNRELQALFQQSAHGNRIDSS